MRRLNHEHIFDIPLRQDGALSDMLERITPGLDRAADDLRQDRKYCDIVGKLGERYLHHEGPSLIHGDLFPGSLLQTASGEQRVIAVQGVLGRAERYGSSIRNSAFVETLNSISVSSMRICCFPNMARTPSPGGCKSLWKIRSTPIL
jgi:hypothetical protein